MCRRRLSPTHHCWRTVTVLLHRSTDNAMVVVPSQAKGRVDAQAQFQEAIAGVAGTIEMLEKAISFVGTQSFLLPGY